MRKTATALATTGLLLMAACAQEREEPVAGIGRSTTTTVPEGTTTVPGTAPSTPSSRPTTSSPTVPETAPSPTPSIPSPVPPTTPEPPGGPDDDRGDDEPCASGTPVWASAPGGVPRAERALHVAAGGARQVPDDCDPEGELGTGDVQITLRWESSADLDLHVIEPDGTEIWYGDTGPTATGGRLDVDSNIGCEDDGSVENVYWPEGQLPTGRYTVEVNGYQVDGCGEGRYTLTAEVEGREVLQEAGTVGEDEVAIHRFEV